MGYNNGTDSGRRWLVFDIETAGRDDVGAWIPAPSADKRLTDPVKVAADLERKRLDATEKLPLDMNGCRIVAFGYQTEELHNPVVDVFTDTSVERDWLRGFLELIKNRTLVGYCSRRFDLPVIFQRCRLLGLPIPNWRRLLAPYGRAEWHVDLYDELTFDGSRDDYVLPRKLVTFAGLFGVDVPTDDCDGKAVAELLKAGDLDAIREHCHHDILRTVGLARRLGVIPALVEEVSLF